MDVHRSPLVGECEATRRVAHHHIYGVVRSHSAAMHERLLVVTTCVVGLYSVDSPGPVVVVADRWARAGPAQTCAMGLRELGSRQGAFSR